MPAPRFFQRRQRAATSKKTMAESRSSGFSVEKQPHRLADDRRPSFRQALHSKLTNLIRTTSSLLPRNDKRRRRRSEKRSSSAKQPNQSRTDEHNRAEAAHSNTDHFHHHDNNNSKPSDKSQRSHNSLECTATSSVSCEDHSGRYLENMIIFTQREPFSEKDKEHHLTLEERYYYQPEEEHLEKDASHVTDPAASSAASPEKLPGIAEMTTLEIAKLQQEQEEKSKDWYEGLHHAEDQQHSTQQQPPQAAKTTVSSSIPPPAFGTPIEQVYNGVHDGPILGTGLTGQVRLITHRQTKEQFALKVLDLTLVESPAQLQDLRQEIFILCQLDHPNIVTLEEVYESETHIYLVQELCCGGELFDCLEEQPDYHYTESETRGLVKQILCAVRYLHSKGIIHRDLKLENFLFYKKCACCEHQCLKMIDFGLSKHFCYGEVQTDTVGTPYTVAPEVIQGSYDERCDMWGVAVLCYLLLSGETPFGGDDPTRIPMSQVKQNILQGRYQFEPRRIWKDVSADAHAFIDSLLVLDPKERPTARMAQLHTWLQEK